MAQLTKKDFLDPEMGTKLSILLQSNLSDSLIEMDFESKKGAKTRINFVKFCINIFDGDLNVRINSDKLAEYYLKIYS